jgi:hypothetical protein
MKKKENPPGMTGTLVNHFRYKKPKAVNNDFPVLRWFFGISLIILFFLLAYSNVGYADERIENPCNQIFSVMEAENHLDIGNDENFERIKQQNNREIIQDCQKWEESHVRNTSPYVPGNGNLWNNQGW